MVVLKVLFSRDFLAFVFPPTGWLFVLSATLMLLLKNRFGVILGAVSLGFGAWLSWYMMVLLAS